MNSLFAYIRKLPASFTKNDLAKKIQQSLDAISNQILPMVEDVKEGLGANLESREAKAWVTSFAGAAGIRKHDVDSVLTNIEATLKILLDNGPTLVDFVNTELTNVTMTKAISDKAATASAIADTIDFIANFTAEAVTYLVILESRAVSGNKNISDGWLTKAKQKMINSLSATYGRLIGFYYANGKLSFKELSQLPDNIIKDNGLGEYVESLSSNKTKHLAKMPMTMGFIGNPAYHIGLYIEDVLIARYERMKENRTAMRYRLMYLKSQRTNEDNPSLEKQIAYYDEKIAKLDYKIKKFEDSAK